MKALLTFVVLCAVAVVIVLSCGGKKCEEHECDLPTENTLPQPPAPSPQPSNKVFVERPVSVQDNWDVEALALGDVDGDGFADLVLTTSWTYYYADQYWYSGTKYYAIYSKPYSSTRLLLGDGRGVFSPKAGALPVPSKAKGLDVWHGDMAELGDLDGDGNLDLSLKYTDPAVSDYYDTFYSYKDNGKKYSYWARYWYLTYGVLPYARALKGSKAGKFTKSSMQPTTGWRSDQLKALGDLDGDGDLDKIAYENGAFRMWLWEER